jgi:spore coat polysaccharide biosynthesis protein SpsF
MKIGITIEARMGSTRLSQKIVRPLLNKPMLARMIERLKQVKLADVVVLATTDEPESQVLVDLAKEMGIECYLGSCDDVLDRVLKAAKTNNIDLIVETCGDCPLIDPDLIDQEIQTFLDNDVDYVGCHLVKTYPLGLDAKLFTTETLEEVSKLTADPADRENVSLYIYEHPERYKLFNIEAVGKFRRPDLRLVVDYEEDFILIEKVYQSLYGNNPAFRYPDILNFLARYPELTEINKNVVNIAVAGREDVDGAV